MTSRKDIVVTPPAGEIARCLHAGQAVSFVVEEWTKSHLRRERCTTRVRFALVPMSALENSADVFASDRAWLVWQDATGAGEIAELPSGGHRLAARWDGPLTEPRVAGEGLRMVIQSAWDLLS